MCKTTKLKNFFEKKIENVTDVALFIAVFSAYDRSLGELLGVFKECGNLSKRLCKPATFSS